MPLAFARHVRLSAGSVGRLPKSYMRPIPKVQEVHPLAYDYRFHVELRSYEEPRLERAANDICLFLKEEVPPILEQRLAFVRDNYTTRPVENITVPDEVRDEPDIRDYTMHAAKGLEQQLVNAIENARNVAPVDVDKFVRTWTVNASAFKYGYSKRKLDEIIYMKTVTIDLPVRDLELEERLIAIPAWLPIGVQATILQKRIENFTCPLTLQNQGDVMEGKSWAEYYLGANP